MKQCNTCKETKELSAFSKDIRRKDGLKSFCKLCAKEFNRKCYSKKAEEHGVTVQAYKLAQQKKCYEANPEKYGKGSLYHLRCNIGSLIREGLKNKNWGKNTKTENILGCSFEEFKKHIEAQFWPDMSWDNFGAWHLDHKTPVSWAANEKEILQLNHYTNIQPLWAEDNIWKGSKVAA